jgi:triosephosphate isomerase
MRNTYIAGNWKMNKTIKEAETFANDLRKAFPAEKGKLMIAPPFTALPAVSAILKGSTILLGAQNCGPELSGAHTGEISLLMLKDCGVAVVILGHSERRHNYLESDELINKKVKLALAQGFEVILCVGETGEEREKGVTEKVVDEQVAMGLQGVSVADMSRLTIAYEPVWAIGTGKNATPDDADSVHAFIRRLIAGMYGQAAAENLIIQYGGSVKPNNIKDLMAKKNIDGALVGGAALTIDQFVPSVQYYKA